jgi:membrane protease YdiL (CAAX protease family)
MSLPPNPLPEELQPMPAASAPETQFETPASVLLPVKTSFPAWSGWDVLAITFFGIICLIVLIAVAVFASGVASHVKSLSVEEFARNALVLRASLAGQAAGYLVVLAAMAILVRSRSKERFGRGIEWNWPGASAITFFICGIILALVVDGASRFLPMPKSLPIEDFFNDRTNAYLTAAFGVSLAPLLEELFFRGLLYPVLRRRLGLITAVVLTAIGFAAIHSVQLGYAWAPIMSIFVVGVVFTLVRQRWSSVGASFVLHSGYNFTLFTLLWFASDHFRHLDKVKG